MDELLDDFIKIGIVFVIIVLIALVLLNYLVPLPEETLDFWTNYPSDFYFFRRV